MRAKILEILSKYPPSKDYLPSSLTLRLLRAAILHRRSDNVSLLIRAGSSFILLPPLRLSRLWKRDPFAQGFCHVFQAQNRSPKVRIRGRRRQRKYMPQSQCSEREESWSNPSQEAQHSARRNFSSNSQWWSYQTNWYRSIEQLLSRVDLIGIFQMVTPRYRAQDAPKQSM